MSERERRLGTRKKEQCSECGGFTWVNENKRCFSCDQPEPAGKDNDAGKEEQAEAKGGGTNNCGKCKVEVKSTDNGLFCELCRKWFHAGCGKCSLSLYKVLQEEDQQLWFCPECRPGVVQACAQVKRLKEENQTMKQEMKELKEKYEDLTKEIKQMDERRKVREEGMVDRAVGEAVKRMEMLLAESERQKEEKEDRERRRKNVIIFNLPESNKEQGKDRELDDKQTCEQVFERTLNVGGCKIEKVFRLGKKQDAKVRPTMVKFEDEVSKWQIISKAKYLKEQKDETIKGLIISLDLTLQQREEDYKLRQELKRRREAGEQCIIKRGKIVTQQNIRRY